MNEKPLKNKNYNTNFVCSKGMQNKIATSF